MTIKYLYFDNNILNNFSSGIEMGENWQIAAKEAFYSYYLNFLGAMYVGSYQETIGNFQYLKDAQGNIISYIETMINYTDPVTGIVADSQVLKDAQNNLLSNRLTDPYIFDGTYNPTDTNKVIYPFDDTETAEYQAGYYTTQSWRDANTGADATIITQEEAEADGFDFGTE